MKIPALGPLRRDPQIEERLRSKRVPIPYFDGLKLPFTIEGLKELDESEVVAAVNAFLQLAQKDKLKAGYYVFKNYRRIVKLAGRENVSCEISSEKDVWNHVRPREIYVSRRRHGEKSIYIKIAAACDWNEEHGLQIIYRRGGELSRVSDPDGHLTHSDAYNLPEGQDRIC